MYSIVERLIAKLSAISVQLILGLQDTNSLPILTKRLDDEKDVGELPVLPHVSSSWFWAVNRRPAHEDQLPIQVIPNGFSLGVWEEILPDSRCESYTTCPWATQRRTHEDLIVRSSARGLKVTSPKLATRDSNLMKGLSSGITLLRLSRDSSPNKVHSSGGPLSTGNHTLTSLPRIVQTSVSSSSGPPGSQSKLTEPPKTLA